MNQDVLLLTYLSKDFTKSFHIYTYWQLNIECTKNRIAVYLTYIIRTTIIGQTYKILQQLQQYVKYYNNILYKTIITNYCESYSTQDIL